MLESMASSHQHHRGGIRIYRKPLLEENPLFTEDQRTGMEIVTDPRITHAPRARDWIAVAPPAPAAGTITCQLTQR